MTNSLNFSRTENTCLQELAGIAQSRTSYTAAVGPFGFSNILSRKGRKPFKSITLLGSAFFVPLSQGLKYSAAFFQTLNIFLRR